MTEQAALTGLIVGIGMLAAAASAVLCSIALASLVMGAITRRDGESWWIAGLAVFWALVATACTWVTR